MINPNGTAIEYAAQTRLMNLAEAADTNKKLLFRQSIDEAARIMYYLDALAYKAYLEDTQINNIYECLKSVAKIYEIPVVPSGNGTITPPTTNVGPPGEPGIQGPPGQDGGATDFTSSGVTFDTIVDTFVISNTYAARWDYLVNGTAQRAGSIYATWTEDGASVDWSDISTPDINGSTSQVDFSVTISSGNVRLNALVTGGTWTITGSRYFIPNNGAGTGPISNSLTDGTFYIGNTSNIAQSRTISGAISITNTGVCSITPAIITNNEIAPLAGIAANKLAAQIASRAIVSDASGSITTSTATAVEIGYLSGATSNIQTQLDSKLSGAAGAISTVTALNLTPDRVVISNGSGKIAVSGVSPTELSYVGGVTSSIQTQLNNKVNSVGVTLFEKVVNIGVWDMDATVSVNVPHGIADFKKIREISVFILDDALTSTGSLLIGGTIYFVDATNISLLRTAAGLYDNTFYNDGVMNRGYVTIKYEA